MNAAKFALWFFELTMKVNKLQKDHGQLISMELKSKADGGAHVKITIPPYDGDEYPTELELTNDSSAYEFGLTLETIDRFEAVAIRQKTRMGEVRHVIKNADDIGLEALREYFAVPAPANRRERMFYEMILAERVCRKT